MEFRDLKKQYLVNKSEIDHEIAEVLETGRFIGGPKVSELESELADYVGMKHCISCANGTDALELALMAWGIGRGDAVFVPDFTFFSSAEVVSILGATPIFVDVDSDTFNIDPAALEAMIERTITEGVYEPKVIVAVDLFGLPANFPEIGRIADKYGLKILEDGAQGFGGMTAKERACAFGDISTTSFFPAKPLGCYGDGGAVFTNDDDTDALIRSLCVHGKGKMKYDNIRIGMNSRLDSLQAGILTAKFRAFREHELEDVNNAAALYKDLLGDIVKTPYVPQGYYSSWAQYTIQLNSRDQRDGLQAYLKEAGIPSMVYYIKPMHLQKAFDSNFYRDDDYPVTMNLCDRVLSLPMHPYLTVDEIKEVAEAVASYIKNEQK